MKQLAFYTSAIALALTPALATAQEVGTNSSDPESSQNGMLDDSADQPIYGGYHHDSGNQNGNGSSNQNGCFSLTCTGGNAPQGSFTLQGYVGMTRAGQAGAVFDAEQGEAGASSSGIDVVEMRGAFSTCDDASCEDNGFSASFQGLQTSESYAIGLGHASAQPVYASSLGTSALVGELGVGINQCPTNDCPTSSSPNND